jgi:hypothetical protein
VVIVAGGDKSHIALPMLRLLFESNLFSLINIIPI